MSRVAVVGAGPAGLAAALGAAEAGHRVVVFEASEAVGGMAASFDIAGVRVDYGSHRLHASTAPAFLDRLVGLLGDDLQARQRNGRIRLHGRWVGFPLRLGDMIRHLPPSFGARVAVEAAAGPLRSRRGLCPERRASAGRGSGGGGSGGRGSVGSDAGAADSGAAVLGAVDSGFMAEVSRRLGATVAAQFYGPYATKLYGVNPSRLSSELARRRVAATSPLAIVAKALRAGGASGRTFYYPRHGFGQVSEALAHSAVVAGADIRLGCPVTAIQSGPEPSVTAGTATEQFDVVLSTMAVPPLIDALQPQASLDIRRALAAMRTRAVVLVYLVLPQGQYTPFDAHYFPSIDITTSRLSEPKNYRTANDPTDVTVLCAEIPCWKRDQVWGSTDDDLAGLVVDDLGRAGLPPVEPIMVESRRLPAVYPVYERHNQHQRDQIDQWLATVPGVLSFGRHGLGVPDNLHHVLAMGADAAAVLSAGGIDRQGWHDALARFETHVVVD